MSMSEGGVGISRPRVVELKQMLSEFQTGQLKTIANDLKATGGSNLAENLKEAHRYLVDRVQPNDEAGEARAKAEAVRSECWDKLSSGGGWPNQGWREAYVFSLMLVSMHIIDASSGGASSPDDLCEAMRHLDMALIMGGPGAGDIVLPMVDTVEPSLKRAMPPLSPEEEADESSWIIGGDLPTSSPVIDDVKAIKRVAKIPFAEFKKSFFKTDTPVIITGATEGWPGSEKWRDLRYLRREYGHRTVPVEIGRLEGGRKKEGEWREESLLLRDLIDRYMSPSNRRCCKGEDASGLEVAYLAQHMLFDQIPQLQGDIELPEYTECGGLEGVNAWLGTSGTVTPLHCDSYDNLLTQAVGFKYVRLYDRKQTPMLYVNRAKDAPVTDVSAQGNISPVEIESPDLSKFPLFKDAQYEEAVLGPGDMLYIPSKHWHYVRSLSPSFSVNFWF